MPGQTVHHIHIDVSKARLSCHAEGIFKIRKGMDTADAPQKRILRALKTDGKAVDPGSTVLRKLVFRQCTGVALHGDLGIEIDGEMVLKHLHQGCDLPHRRGTGSAAPDKCGIEGQVSCHGCGKRDFFLQSAKISFEAVPAREGYKIAVSALLDAERYV